MQVDGVPRQDTALVVIESWRKAEKLRYRTRGGQ